MIAEITSSIFNFKSSKADCSSVTIVVTSDNFAVKSDTFAVTSFVFDAVSEREVLTLFIPVTVSEIFAVAPDADVASPLIPSATVFNSEPLALNSSIPVPVSFVLSRNEPRFSFATPVA